MIRRLIKDGPRYHAILLDETGRIFHKIFNEKEKAHNYLISLRKKNKIVEYKIWQIA